MQSIEVKKCTCRYFFAKAHLLFWGAFLLLSPFFGCHPPAEKAPATYPNIIYILADDLGYGDLSCTNDSSKIHTPHIDRLAAQGMLFTDAHSGSAVCTPTRYGILTGRYAWRTWMKNGVLWSYDEPLIDTSRLTVASLLRRHGYHTACIGKWHLGLGWTKDSLGQVDFRQPIQGGPNALGFDYFFGITASLDIPPYFYIENDRITAQTIDTIAANEGMGFWREGPIGDDFGHEEVLPKLTEQALRYIAERADKPEPFFLYFPLPAPHTPILPSPAFLGKSNTNAYGDFVLMVDDVAGQVMDALEQHGLADNTIVIFTSDNGCSPMADFEALAQIGHHPSYIYRGHKADIFEGGHRIPFMARWPGKVQAGRVSPQTICLTDLLRTCAAIVGDSLPGNAGEDSCNLMPVLLGTGNGPPLREATVHHSINGSFSIRKGPWKLEFCRGSGGWSHPRPEEVGAAGLPLLQLYNLDQDPREQENMAGRYPEIVAELTQLMERYVREGRSTPGAAQQNEGETRFLPDEAGAGQ